MKHTVQKVAASGFWVLLLLLFGSAVRAESPDDILIIVNKNVPVQDLSREEVRSLFMMLRTSFASSSRAVALNAQSGTPLRDAFRKRVLEMSLKEELRHWQEQKVRSGRGAPAEFSNPLKAVFKIKNSIGYIYRSDFREGVVKIVHVVPAGGS